MADTLENIADSVTKESTNEFNSEVHVTHDDGTPKYNKDGSKKRKRGKRIDEPEPSVIDIPHDEAYEEMGGVMAVTVTSCFTMFFGQDWRPANEELSAMQSAWAKYFEVTGVSEFPPWAMLAMVHAGYVGKRLTMPDTTSRFRQIIQWWRNKRNARSNMRYDQQRQDDAGEEPSSNI